jgi:protein transport protein SEC61 subunit alpha
MLLKDVEHPQTPGQSIPVGGLAYYVSPPGSLQDVLMDPFHAIFYLTFVLTTCALFSKTWIEVSGSSPRDVYKQLRDQNVVIAGSFSSFLIDFRFHKRIGTLDDNDVLREQ